MQKKIPKPQFSGYGLPRGKQNLRHKRGRLTPEPGRRSASLFAGNCGPRVVCRLGASSNQLLNTFHSENARGSRGGREYTFKMAARWGVCEETLTACNMDIFQMDTLDEVKNLLSTHSLVFHFNCYKLCERFAKHEEAGV